MITRSHKTILLSRNDDSTLSYNYSTVEKRREHTHTRLTSPNTQQAYLIYRKMAEAPLIWEDTQNKIKWNLFTCTHWDRNQTETEFLRLTLTASQPKESTRVQALPRNWEGNDDWVAESRDPVTRCRQEWWEMAQQDVTEDITRTQTSSRELRNCSHSNNHSYTFHPYIHLFMHSLIQ
jgi:hypothetical protein